MDQACTHGALAAQVARIAAADPPAAAGFIVTIYGDAILPRGGEVWIGSLIETCALVGLSETLVRTAVSRLVSAGQLEGWRRGRRSFYRLSDSARAGFAVAARQIYGPPPVDGWRFVHLPDEGAMPLLERQGYARLKPNLALGPAHLPAPRGALSFAAQPEGEAESLRAFAAGAWDLAPHAAAYTALVDSFGALAPPGGDGAAALAARLLLVHRWRRALLADPRLPAAALPPDWPGHAARALFSTLYAQLATAADAWADALLVGASGPLTATAPTPEYYSNAE